MKSCIDENFEAHYGLRSRVGIREKTTCEAEFDLTDKDEAKYIVAFGGGEASFENSKQDEIEVLAFDKFITRINKGYKAFENKKICDFILVDKTSKTVILNELTSSTAGMENLEKPLPDKPYSKFGKAEKQLEDSLALLCRVEEVKQFMNEMTRKVCLLSYRLYAGKHTAAQVFDRANRSAARLAGCQGEQLHSQDIEKFGFEYIRISHDNPFKIN